MVVRVGAHPGIDGGAAAKRFVERLAVDARAGRLAGVDVLIRLRNARDRVSACLRAFSREDARRIGQPVLAVLGARSDEVRPTSEGVSRVFRQRHELLLAWLPNVEPLILPDATHLLHVENPRGMAEGLAAFFARHPLKGAMKHRRQQRVSR